MKVTIRADLNLNLIEAKLFAYYYFDKYYDDIECDYTRPIYEEIEESIRDKRYDSKFINAVEQ